MPEIALHTRLRPDCVAEYAAGVRDWRDGTDLSTWWMLVDYHAMREYLRDHSANVAWQAQVDVRGATRGRDWVPLSTD